MEAVMSSRLQSFKILLGFLQGIAVTLFVVMLVGDVSFYDVGFPFGWAVLWLVTSIGSIPLGIVMLIGRSWRSLPLAQRRGTAMGYLMVGFVNGLTLAARTSIDYGGPGLWYLLMVYGMFLFVVYAATRPEPLPREEEMFP